MAEATTERRKLAVIGHCGACPHFKGRTRLQREEACMMDATKASEILYAYGEQNDGTAHPWWAVVAKNRMGPQAILAGPFFSRERAEQHRQARLYEYGKGSVVWCFSGHNSQHYRDLREALKEDADAKH